MKKRIALMLSLILLLGSVSALADMDMYFTYATEAYSFTQDGLARFKALNGMYGYVNTKGVVVIDPVFARAEDFSSGKAKVSYSKYGNDYFNINTQGVDVNGPKNISVPTSLSSKDGDLYYGNELLADGGWYGIDLYDPKYVYEVENTKDLLCLNGHILLNTVTGKKLIIDAEDISRSMSNGLIAVTKDGVGFYIDEQGVMQIPPVGTHAYAFHDGIARVKDEDCYFYIDTQGNRVSGYFQEATDMINGYAAVKRYDQWHVVDRYDHIFTLLN